MAADTFIYWWCGLVFSFFFLDSQQEVFDSSGSGDYGCVCECVLVYVVWGGPALSKSQEEDCGPSCCALGLGPEPADTPMSLSAA